MNYIKYIIKDIKKINNLIKKEKTDERVKS